MKKSKLTTFVEIKLFGVAALTHQSSPRRKRICKLAKKKEEEQ